MEYRWVMLMKDSIGSKKWTKACLYPLARQKYFIFWACNSGGSYMLYTCAMVYVFWQTARQSLEDPTCKTFRSRGLDSLKIWLIRFPVSSLAVSFPYFLRSFIHRNLPDPTNILGGFYVSYVILPSTHALAGCLCSENSDLRPWKGNRWRKFWTVDQYTFSYIVMTRPRTRQKNEQT